MATHLRLASEAIKAPRPAPGVVRVVLADDHAMVRRTLRVLFDCETDIDVVAEAADLADVVAHVAEHRPHVLVLDLRLPGGSSIDAIRRLTELSPETQIIVLSMDQSPLFAQQALDAGAAGYVPTDRADTELMSAIRCATRGEQYVSPRIAAAVDGLRKAVDGDGLSPRETEVLRLIALGYTSAEVAAQLHLSRRTVETHRARLYGKLGVSNRAGLVQFALRRELIGT